MEEDALRDLGDRGRRASLLVVDVPNAPPLACGASGQAHRVHVCERPCHLLPPLGGVLLELLEPLDDRSPHAEFLASHGEGPHHLAFLLDDFDEQLAAASGLERLIDGTGPGNPIRWVYLDGSTGRTGGLRGTVIELLERTPVAEAVFGPALALLAG